MRSISTESERTLSELRDRRPLPVGDVHGREHDGKPVGLGETRHRHDVAGQQIVVDRRDRLNLARLVVDDDECGILRREQRISYRITRRFTRHDRGSSRRPPVRRLWHVRVSGSEIGLTPGKLPGSHLACPRKQQVIACFTVPTSTLSRFSREPALIGRRHELDTLAELVEHARSGQSGVLVVRGEPGIGKSALLDDVERRAHGFLIARVRGSRVGDGARVRRVATALPTVPRVVCRICRHHSADALERRVRSQCRPAAGPIPRGTGSAATHWPPSRTSVRCCASWTTRNGSTACQYRRLPSSPAACWPNRSCSS